MNYKLGKRPAKRDSRNLQLKAVLKELPPIPADWDFDVAGGSSIPLPVFANDKWGDCVMAARAHQTLRFEDFEQKAVIPISDNDVLKEYWKEQGANCRHRRPDNGLVVLDSLKCWRKKGWKAAGKSYSIYAFAEVSYRNHDEVMAAIYLLSGACIGLQLPVSAESQFDAGQPWDITTGPDAEPGSLGGHCVYLVGYGGSGPVGVTWGKKQPMTWAFLDRYCDELYAIVDNRDKFLRNSPVDVDKLAGYLEQLN